MAESKDYYSILGVSKDATADDLKKAYRKLAKQYHPDAQHTEEDKKKAEAKFKEINEAYSVLSDDNKRAQYDRFGSNFEQAGFGSGFNGGTYGFSGFDGGFGGIDIDLEDILGSVFGGGFGSSKKSQGPVRGADLRATVTLKFEEAAFGVKKEINVTRNEKCDTCGGSGAKPGSKIITCDKCGGRGKVQATQNTIMGAFATVRTCDKCQGSGKVIETPCEKCAGKGRIRKNRKIEVSIPSGIDDGQALPLRGEGDAGTKGGPNGDLYVVVKVLPHKYFKRNGFDISANVRVPFTKMALGGEIKIPTLEGEMEYTIPEGTTTGTKFKVKEQGIPILNGKGRGTLEFTVDVDVPKKLTDEQRELLIQFAKTFGDEVSGKRKSIFEDIKNKFN